MSNPAIRIGASVLALTAFFATSACQDDGKTDAKSSPTASTSAASSQPSAPSTPPPPPLAPSPTAVPKTADGAIARYETVLHALSRGDLKTVCAIAGPAAKKAEAAGFGKCRTTFTIMRSMFSDPQLSALRTATIDKSKVIKRANGNVEIPTRAVVSKATFTEDDLGGVTLAYRHGNWFMVD
ncbi:hypothetical protein J4573_12380 [Actinomadura barringtoniae]|uniref:Lipoprotein n=1 Tax=Actinomadura barringtoniae TaxID=1427535 RepID=A0A939T659_9ACTN|nr:hypothetical protein [Actinomadura barringtoniae]MBO2447892.1 hypothetical protein [Actinomadura barringtoniae]